MNPSTRQRHGVSCALSFWPPLALAALLAMSGCTTTTIAPDDTRAPDVRFDPVYGSHEFPPRPGPATITRDDDEVLVRKGYYKLGTLKVDVNKHDQERLGETFLREAAAHGGDVVRPTVEMEAFREEDTIVGETAGGTAPAYTPGRMSALADGVDADPHSRPVEWGGGAEPAPPQTIYQKGAKRFRSEGTVWRYDPQKGDLKSAERAPSPDVKKDH